MQTPRFQSFVDNQSLLKFVRKPRDSAVVGRGGGDRTIGGIENAHVIDFV